MLDAQLIPLAVFIKMRLQLMTVNIYLPAGVTSDSKKLKHKKKV